MPILETAAGRLHYFDSAQTDATLAADGLPTLLLLHSSGASHRQWRQLIGQVTQNWRILAPDLFGYGGTPLPRSATQPASILQAEMDLLGALLQQVDEPVHVIGHSYGGAVALELALLHPTRIAALAVYEPVMFALLRDSVEQDAWREIAHVAQRTIDLVGAGDLRTAASAFLAYWVAPGAFEALPEAQQATLAAGMPKVAAEFGALLQRHDARPDFGVLTMPVLLMCGSDTTCAARGVSAELRRLLPGPDFREVSGGRHMAPLQQPDLVNPLLLDFLDRTATCARSQRQRRAS
jgi:pimeloyl-ACP methyl ester carboxylesterase